MRISPYVSFGGNCADAIALYEKAFDVKAIVSRYGEAPQESGYKTSEDYGNLVMHAQFEVGGEVIMLCDMPPDNPITAGDSVAIMVEFDDVAAAKAAFDVLKDGDKVGMELQETFWSKCFGSLTDRFGINWYISINE